MGYVSKVWVCGNWHANTKTIMGLIDGRKLKHDQNTNEKMWIEWLN